MKNKKGIALLISLALVIGTVLPGTLALSADEASGSGTIEVSAETPVPDAAEAPSSEETVVLDETPAEEPAQTCTCDPAPAEGEAHKEGCPLYEAPQQPTDEQQPEEEQTDYTDLFNRFLAAQTYEEFDTIYQELTEEERTAFAAWLTENGENDKMEALQAHFSQLYIVDEPQEEEPIVPFTNVGPLLAAPVARPRMLRAPSKAGDNSGIVLNKTAAVNSDGSYTITLEAYATGETTTTVTHQPVDIVLVLDVSGSMDETFGFTKVYDVALDKSKTYYILDILGISHSVKWFDSDRCWKYNFGLIWVKVVPKTSPSDDSNTQFYEENTTKKISALKTAVNGFIDSVAAKSPDSNIAIVKFAGNKTDKVGNDTYSGWPNNYNYSEIVTNLTAAGTGVTDLKDAVNALNPAGATAADYGMQHAQSIINEAASDGKKKVVIMFTDGEPTYNSDFETSVANNAISASKGIKDNGATVYTIGVFSGAKGAPVASLDEVDKTNKYMHLVSSNYKNATSMNNTGEATYPTGGKSYFLSASNADELSTIFQSISQEVGGATTTLDETATIKDIVSPYFTMPADAENVTVKTAKSNGSTVDWEKAVLFKGTVSIDTASSAVSVSGFNFKDNWCGNQTDANGNTTFHNGQKLIIEFNVSRKEDFLGGNDVPTNGENSGIYDKDGTEVKKFDVPTVNVPIEDVTVKAEDKNVYLLGDVPADQLKNGATVEVGKVKLDLSKADQNYGLEPWQTKYVNITVKVKDKDSNEISADSLKNLTDDTTYTVEVTVTPTKPGTFTTEKGDAATAKTGKNDLAAKINVFKPELTFKDTTAYYGEAVPENNNYSDNKVGSETWKHGNTTSSDTGVTMLGDKPPLVISYKPDTSKLDNGKYTKQDVPVSAIVKIGEENVNQHTKFVHENCTEDGCSWTDPAKKGEPAFLIHVKTCTLKITKTGGANDESYVFDVYKDDTSTKYSEVTIWGNDTATLYELPVGTYTIKENEGWSWRYTANNGSSAELTAVKPDGSITCNNTMNKKQWLNGFSTVVRNIYGEKH